MLVASQPDGHTMLKWSGWNMVADDQLRPAKNQQTMFHSWIRTESFFLCQCSGLQADVPLAVVEEILLNLPAHQVVRVCRLVCHEWKELVDSAAHWRVRCRRERIQPCDASRPPYDWRLFYFLTKKRRNLLKNPEQKVSHIIENV